MHSVSFSLPSSTDISDVPTLVKRDPNCRTVDDGESYGETEGLRILDEFRKLYETRIEKIDQESIDDSDRVSVSSSFVIVSLYLLPILFVLFIYSL